jgi:putative exosortase-associated protein (TIGR04073 family)
MKKQMRSVLLASLMGMASLHVDAEGANGMSEKLGHGFSNLALAWLEIPKNVVLTTNQSNVAVGLTGGTIRGIVHTSGRILSGVVDLVSFPFPTQPVAEPGYVWQNFSSETRYNSIFESAK